MDRELIAMCDCPEIQGKWELKEAQIVQDRLTGWNKTVAHENSYGICLYNGCGTLITGRCKDSLIYIPHIDDLLEWIGDKFDYLRLDATTGSWRVAVMAIAEVSNGYTPTQALLKAYMNLSHNKTWDGKAWT